MITITTIGGLSRPDAFNAGIMPYQDGYLIAYRATSRDPAIGFALLDRDLRVIAGTARDRGYSQNDDPRIIPGNLVPGLETATPFLLSTNYYPHHWQTCRMELRQCDVFQTAGVVHTIRPDEVCGLGKFDAIGGLTKQQAEKNWAPFLPDNTLRFVYSINPHRIIAYDFPSRSVALQHTTDWQLPNWWQAETWGTELRGSSPPVLVGDRYLSTWHTRKGPGYWTGLYTFSATAPFAPLEIGPPVLTPDMSTGTNTRNPNGQGCLFINGMVVEPDRILLSGGDNDHSVIVATLDRVATVATLRPIGETLVR
jgi:predicted GH43/DUF377 family glycosyl hydrolase